MTHPAGKIRLGSKPPVPVTGDMWNDPDHKTASVQVPFGESSNQIGQEAWWLVKNNSGGDIDDGEVVYASGVDNGYLTIDLAQANVFSAVQTLGFATGDILDGEIGLVTSRGEIHGLDTSLLDESGILYLSDTVAGGVTQTKPLAPNKIILLGTVTVKDASDGIIYVAVNVNQVRILGQKSYGFTSQGIGSGVHYLGGFYQSSAGDSNLTQASATQLYGSEDASYASHAFIVAGGAGSASGGSGAVEIEVSGTSITDAGVRTESDTEIIVADITALALDEYAESSKKWLGEITYTLQNAGGSTQTTFSVDFNYGLCKYEDIANQDFSVSYVEVVGLAGANDTVFDIEVLKHTTTGWTYHATTFVPGNGAIAQMSTDHGAERDLVNGEQFAWKHTGLNVFIDGNGSEGIVIRVTTGQNNSVQSMDCHLGVYVDTF